VEHVISAGPDYSVYGLVMHADPVVKGVLVLLLLASVAVWAIVLEKIVRLRRLSNSVGRIELAMHQAPDPGDRLVGSVLAAAKCEDEGADQRSESVAELRGFRERAMRSALKSELRRLEVGLPLLATVGSAAPFIGLFGTVWGIVNSFTAIAQQKDTSLAVVAPGIAEALIATAIGLAAAIPAVVAYNQISVSLGRAYARGIAAILELAKRPIGVQAGDEPVPIRAGKRY
jgi:biopolymer transport protein ExbB/TolQ